MLSSVWQRPAGQPAAASVPVLGHLIRGTDRVLDVLHGVYERLIRWVFSGRRYRLRCRRSRLAAVRRRRAARRDAPRRWRLATRDAARRGRCWSASAASSARSALAPLVGTEFIPQTDQSFIAAQRALPVGTSLERGSDEGARRSRRSCARFPEVRMVSTTIGDTGNGIARNQAHAEHRSSSSRSERKRTQKQVEDAMRDGAEADPRHRGVASASTGRSTSPCSGTDPEVLEAEVAASFAEQGRRRSRASPTCDRRSSPACRPTRCG